MCHLSANGKKVRVVTGNALIDQIAIVLPSPQEFIHLFIIHYGSYTRGLLQYVYENIYALAI
jgi:hypothetical protein